MALCKCTNVGHGHAIPCENESTEIDGYCKLCHDEAAKTFHIGGGSVPGLPPGYGR